MAGVDSLAKSCRFALSGLTVGSVEWRRKAQEFALRVAAADPALSQSRVAVLLGCSERTIINWLYRYPEFREAWERVRGASKEGGPPPVPSFEQWREQYVNVEEENPMTLRKQPVGVTFPFMRPLVEALGREKRILAVWPIRHGKTKILEQYVVYKLCENPNTRILYFCGSETLAKDRIYAVQQMLTDDRLYPELHRTWGAWITKAEGREKRWGSTQFYVRGRQSSERDPSVRGMGIKTNVLGARADIIILDDIDNPSNSPEERRKILRTVNTAIRTRLNEGGQVVGIMNRCGLDDVASVIMSRPGTWVDVQSAITPSGEALCPEMYSLEDLEALREDMTPDEYAMMVLNDPVPEGSLLFPPSLVDNAKRPVDTAPDEWDRYLSMDPARSETAAIVALAHNRSTGEMRVIDCETRKNARHDGMFEMLQVFLARHHPKQVIIEDQGGASSFCDVPSVRFLIADERASLVRFHTGKNKHDPQMGMSLVAAKMSTEKLTIAWGSPETQRRLKPLCDDLIAYRPKATSHHGSHWDAAMALWFVVAHLEKSRTRNTSGSVIDPLAARRPFIVGNRDTLQVDRLRAMVISGRQPDS